MLNRFAKALMDERTRVRRNGENQFIVYGKDKVISTNAAVGANVNRRGNITELMIFTKGENKSIDDDQFMWLDVGNPRKAVKWFTKNASSFDGDPIYIHPSKYQSAVETAANVYNDLVPGLEGGFRDVYVSLGNYEAWA